MSDQKHTAGEWRSYDEFLFADEACTITLGDFDVGSRPIAERQANARLSSAAPNFMAAAQSLIEAWDARTTGAQQIITGKSDRDLQKQAMDAIEGLRAAIAKATAQ